MTDTLHGAGRLLNPARLLVALAAFIGVLGMHGFSADHALAGPTMTAIHSAQPTASSAGMTHEDAVAISTERRASATAVVSVAGGRSCARRARHHVHAVGRHRSPTWRRHRPRLPDPARHDRRRRPPRVAGHRGRHLPVLARRRIRRREPSCPASSPTAAASPPRSPWSPSLPQVPASSSQSGCEKAGTPSRRSRPRPGEMSDACGVRKVKGTGQTGGTRSLHVS